MDVNIIIVEHTLVMSVFLAGIAFLLQRNRLFSWRSVGFWVWSSFLLYFVLSPVASLFTDTRLYAVDLAIAGGADRAMWCTTLLIVGLGCFYFTYLRTVPRPIRFGMDKVDPVALNHFTIVTFVPAVILGTLSLIIYRSGFISTNLTYVSGHVVTPDVTGYQVSGHLLLWVPTLYLILSSRLGDRLLGYMLGLLYVTISALDAYGRYEVVAALIGLALADAFQRRAKLPRLILVAAVLLVAGTLSLRGHVRFSSLSDAISLSEQTSTKTSDILSSADINMLPNMYLETYRIDTFAGYSYGLPILNYALTGFIPYQIFPEKYAVVDAINRQQAADTPLTLQSLLYGNAAGMIANFYAEGNIISVALLSLMVGYLSRRLDGMVFDVSPRLVRALGIAWLSTQWMVWERGTTWAMTSLGFVAAPVIVVWILLRFRRTQANRLHRTQRTPRRQVARSFSAHSDYSGL